MQHLRDIIQYCGLIVERIEPVHGGDINQSYCLVTSTGKYFLKINDKDTFPLMFEKEASALDQLRNHCSLVIPQVIKTGNCYDRQYLLLEWIEKGGYAESMWNSFGSALALMHQKPQKYFGLHEDNYIGALKQINTEFSEWHSFYAECRIMPLVKILFDRGSYAAKDLTGAESFCRELKNIFPEEPASLLHGDLWSGNFMVHCSGYAAIFDPAVYFGHREMDIGMTKLFGGFDQRFYNGYNETYALQKGWERRMPFTQLYPLLVHAVLFGGHCISKTREIMNGFI